MLETKIFNFLPPPSPPPLPCHANSANDEIILKNYLTHQDIASLICSTRQTVTALFNDLKEKGALDYTRNEIIIKNKTLLA